MAFILFGITLDYFVLSGKFPRQQPIFSQATSIPTPAPSSGGGFSLSPLGIPATPHANDHRGARGITANGNLPTGKNLDVLASDGGYK